MYVYRKYESKYTHTYCNKVFIYRIIDKINIFFSVLLMLYN